MSDKVQALAFLQVTSSTCSAALDALTDKEPDSKKRETGEDASIDVVLKDFTSLLSLIYQNTSKLSIALKPSSPTYSASTSPLKELSQYVDALASCACTMEASKYGQTLVKEVRWSAEEVIGALQALLGVFIAEAETPRTGAADSYLVKTGTVHAAIDRAKGVSRSNVEAVKRRWEGDLGGIGDCVEEVQEMVDDEDNRSEVEDTDADGDTDGFTEDDGWGDLGVEMSSTNVSVKATAEELARLKSACHLLKFIQALQKRVLSSLLTSQRILDSPRPSVLDDLLSHSNSLLKASDDLVHALYLPQDSENLMARVKSYRSIVEDLRGVLVALALSTSPPSTYADAAGELSQEAALLSIQLDERREKIAKDRKWFDACLTQIFRTTDAILSTGGEVKTREVA